MMVCEGRGGKREWGNNACAVQVCRRGRQLRRASGAEGCKKYVFTDRDGELSRNVRTKGRWVQYEVRNRRINPRSGMGRVRHKLAATSGHWPVKKKNERKRRRT